MSGHIRKLLVPMLGWAVIVQAGGVHEHGAARLDVAIEGAEVSLHLESPLDGLLGFERAPRDEAEREKVRRMAAALRKADQLYAFPAPAGCVVDEVKLASPVIVPDLLGERGAPAAAHAHHDHAHGEAHGHGHAELAADYRFRCATPARLDRVDVRLFTAFPRIERLDVQVVGPRGQSSARLTPKQSELKLSK